MLENQGLEQLTFKLGLSTSVTVLRTIIHIYDIGQPDAEDLSLRLPSQEILDCVKLTIKTSYHAQMYIPTHRNIYTHIKINRNKDENRIFRSL